MLYVAPRVSLNWCLAAKQKNSATSLIAFKLTEKEKNTEKKTLNRKQERVPIASGALNHQTACRLHSFRIELRTRWRM